MKIKINAEKLADEIEKSIKTIINRPFESESFAIFENEEYQVQIKITRDPDDFYETVFNNIIEIKD